MGSIAALTIALALTAAAGLWLWRRSSREPPAPRLIPLTGARQAVSGSLSPDDRPLAFATTSGREENWDIWLTMVGDSEPAAHDRPQPAWSPDGRCLGGWSLRGILRYESGRSLRIVMANDMAGLLFNTEKRPNRVSGGGTASASFDASTGTYLDKSDWQDPGPLTFGNAPRADGAVRGFKVYNEDIAIAKTFSLTTDLTMRFEALFGNIFNRTTFCPPNTFFTSPAFGTVNTQCNQPRSIRFGFRLDY
jgi:hypothetical protein